MILYSDDELKSGKVIACPHCKIVGERFIPDNGVNMKSVTCEVCGGEGRVRIVLQKI